MRRRRIFYAVTLGIVTVAYATLAVDAHVEGYWQMSRIEGLLLAGITFAWGLVAAPWLWRPRAGDRLPSSIGTVRPPRQRPAEPPRLPPRPTALTETTQILPGAVMAAAWERAQGNAEPAASPVAVAEPEPLPEEPMAIREFGTFLDVREEGFEEGYDVGYDDAENGRAHRKRDEGSAA